MPGVLSRPKGRGIERRRSSVLSISTQNDWDSTCGLFDLWDVDGNGTIEATELENGVKRHIDKNICKLSFKDLGRVVDAVRVATSCSPQVSLSLFCHVSCETTTKSLNIFLDLTSCISFKHSSIEKNLDISFCVCARQLALHLKKWHPPALKV